MSKKAQMGTDVIARRPKVDEAISFLRLLQRLRRFAMTVILLFSCASAHCFNVSPTRIEISVEPSKNYEGELIVRNSEKGGLDIKVRIEDWFKAVEGVAKTESSDFEWLKISPLEFELKEGEAREVNYRINVPKKAKGELNAMLFIDGKPKEVKEGAITINTSIGIPLYAAIKGTERYGAEIEDLRVVKSAPLELEVKIKNTGNVHIRPTGTIEIRSANVIARPDEVGSKQSPEIVLPLNEYNYPILPNSSRTLEIKSNHRLEQGEYVADIKMGFSDKKYKKKITVILK